jgi:imidazolonepropionase-like amidohydrolase
MRTFITVVLVLLCAAAACVASDQIPAAPQSTPVALVGATVHPVVAPPMRNGIVVFDRGTITALGTDVQIPDGATVLNVAGKHVYPGLIDAYTAIGLTEIGSVRGTRDVAETGRINPNVRAEAAVNPGSEIIPVTRANGIALALVAPGGGTISGRSALMMLDGWTWEDMVLKAPAALHVSWPRMRIIHAWWMRQSEEEQKEERQKSLDALAEAFRDARAYQRAKEAETERGIPPHPTDLRWEAMIPVLEGELPVIVVANGIRQIEAAVAWARQENVKLIISGGADAWRVTDLLKDAGVPVMVAGTHRSPQRRWEAYDAPFTLPFKLFEAGVEFCISGGVSFYGSAGASNERNLPYQAATAVAYGLPREEALKSLTLYPARMLGVDDRVGALAVGMDATVIVTDGDPLETPTQVERMFIQGRDIDLTSRHTMLYEKYKQKYDQLR